jgi:hypothetical protein
MVKDAIDWFRCSYAAGSSVYSEIRILCNKLLLKRLQKHAASSYRHPSVNNEGYELIAAHAVIAFWRVV